MRAKTEEDKEQCIRNDLGKMQSIFRSSSENRWEALRKLIFINTLGYDTNWANFSILESLTQEDYSSILITLTAASNMWTLDKDVQFMSANTLLRYLNSGNQLIVSAILSALPSFLNSNFVSLFSKDVYNLISSSSPIIRQKSLSVFYQMILIDHQLISTGIVKLKAALEDPYPPIVFIGMNIFYHLISLFPSSFVKFIPLLHSMLRTTSPETTCLVLSSLRLLCAVEPRLPRKLVEPLMGLLSNARTSALVYECALAVTEIPLSNPTLVSLTVDRVTSFLNNTTDVTERFLFLSAFFKLMKLQPKLVSQNKMLIASCLESIDSDEAYMALELLSSLSTPKNIDTVVSKLYDRYILVAQQKILPSSQLGAFRAKLLLRVIEICSKNDWEIISDFEWYILVLGDFIESGDTESMKISSEILSSQLLDLSTRVPDTRPSLVKLSNTIFDKSIYISIEPLLLAAAHILGQYGSDDSFQRVLQPILVSASSRVQAACISASIELYLRIYQTKLQNQNDLINNNFKTSLLLKLPLFAQSPNPEVQDRASSGLKLVELLDTIEKTPENISILNDFCTYIENDIDHDIDLEIPSEFNSELPLFIQESEEIKTKSKRNHRDKQHRHHRSHHQTEDNKEGQREVKRSSHKKVKLTEKQQIIAKNSSIQLLAKNFIMNSSDSLAFDIWVKNFGTSDISFIVIQIEGSEDVEISNIHANDELIRPLNLTVNRKEGPFAPKVRAIPKNGGEILEGRLRIFPSYFFITVPEVSPEEFSIITQKTTSEFSLESKGDITEHFSSIKTMLKAAEYKSDSENETEKILISRTSDGVYILIYFITSSDTITVKILSEDASFAKQLGKQIEMKLSGDLI